MPTQTLRILLFNLGYCTEIDGSLRSYLLRWYRYLYTPHVIVRDALRGLHRLVQRLHPDLCFFAEVHKDVRSMASRRAYPTSLIDNKYGRWSLLRVLPFFRKNCNGVLARVPVTSRKRYFRNGTKKLIYELTLEDGTVLLFAHFSLIARTRRKQFGELEDIIAGRRNIVLCGDFNTISHPGELRAFAQKTGLRIVNPRWEATYPTAHPDVDIDLFLCSRSIRLRAVEVLHDVRLSDHLPVLLEMEVAQPAGQRKAKKV